MDKSMKKRIDSGEFLMRPTAFPLSPEDYLDPEKMREAQFLEYHFNDLIDMLDKYDKLKETPITPRTQAQNRCKPPILRKWPYLNLLKPQKHLTPDWDGYSSIRKNVADGKDGNTVINFINQYQQWQGNTCVLGNSIVYMRPLGNTSGYWYHVLKKDRKDAIIVAGYEDEKPKAFLVLDWFDRCEKLIELESFYMLSVTQKTNDREVGVMTIHNASSNAVHIKVIEGFPTLKNAYKFSLESDGGKDAKISVADSKGAESENAETAPDTQAGESIAV